MARLIDADAMHKPIYAENDNITGYGMTQDERDLYNEGIRYVLRLVANCPTVDAVPVVHAHWVSLEPVIGLYECSLCGHKILRAKCNYCPNCGSKMDGGTDK